MKYINIRKVNGFAFLNQFGLNILKESISNFLSCNVNIIINPLDQLKKKQIDILKNQNRGFYPINENEIIIIGRIMEENEIISSIGLRIKKRGITKSANFLSIMEGAITSTLTSEYKNRFKNCKFKFGDELILRTIINFFAKNGYDYRHLRHLIDYFNKLRTTSFEGDFFSTGLILTRSHFAYNKKHNQDRFGTTYPLKKSISLANTNKIDRRIWYLVDGKRSFFMCNKSLNLTQLFVLNDEYQQMKYLDSHTLAKSLKGGDLLFKIENEKLFSIINSSNIEISYSENQWKFRNYTFIRGLFSKHFNDNKELIESLLFFIIYCSKNSISSIIWLPKKLEKVEDLVKKQTMNKFIRTPISIREKPFTNHIIRYLSSDGATIIDSKGFLQYFGCIVDLSKMEINGVKGTGESAAGALSSNGISIKVSEDGTIKVFIDKNSKPIII